MKVLHEKCDPKLAENKKLPYTAYLIEYVDKENGEDKVFYDIATCLKQTDMFDFYYDKYKTGLKGWKQSDGRISPKLWDEDMFNPDKKKTSSKKPNQKRK